MAYQIYKITNKINNKSYIGLTTRNYLTRWKEHIQVAFDTKSKDYNAIFKKAIRKYGIDAWTIEVIEQLQDEDLDLLKEREKYWIKYYNTYAFNENSAGYNSTYGGDGTVGFQNINITQFDILSGLPVCSYSSISEASRKIGVRVDYIGQVNHSCNGYCFLITEDIKDMTKQQLIDYVHSLYPYLVYQLDLEGNFINLYKNTAAAADAINYSRGSLILCCEGKRRYAKGFQWVYQKDIEKRLGQPIRPIDVKNCPIIQYKMNGEKLKEWDNIRSAAQALNIQESHICNCCKLQRQSAGKYQWRYAEEDIEKLEPLYTKRQVICNETQEIFETCNHAAKYFGYSQQTIKKSCMGQTIQKPLTFSWYDE